MTPSSIRDETKNNLRATAIEARAAGCEMADLSFILQELSLEAAMPIPPWAQPIDTTPPEPEEPEDGPSAPEQPPLYPEQQPARV